MQLSFPSSVHQARHGCLLLSTVGRPAHRPHPRSLTVTAAQNDFGEAIQRMAKQVQGSLPVVGLLSRIMTPTGGVGNDELSYPDFCRSLYEQGIEPLNIAMSDLEKAYGKATCGMRNVLYCLWTCRDVGIVPPTMIMACVRRLRITQDMEVECDRFEAAKEATMGKYSYLDLPRGSVQQQADLAVDTLACLIGVKDGVSLDEEAAALVEAVVLHGLFANQPKVPEEQRVESVRQALATREARAKAYIVL